MTNLEVANLTLVSSYGCYTGKVNNPPPEEQEPNEPLKYTHTNY